LTDDVKLVGQRMSRSRQRLALDNDPGKTTQAIQDRILSNLDNLIAMARQQQAQAMSRPGRGQGQGQRQQRPQQGDQGQQQARDLGMQQQPNQGQNPVQAERRNGTQDNNAQGKDIREKASEWGGLTPREREAVIEGTHDKVIQKYKKLTDDYYEQMGKKGSQDR